MVVHIAIITIIIVPPQNIPFYIIILISFAINNSIILLLTTLLPTGRSVGRLGCLTACSQDRPQPACLLAARLPKCPVYYCRYYNNRTHGELTAFRKHTHIIPSSSIAAAAIVNVIKPFCKIKHSQVVNDDDDDDDDDD